MVRPVALRQIQCSFGVLGNLPRAKSRAPSTHLGGFFKIVFMPLPQVGSILPIGFHRSMTTVWQEQSWGSYIAQCQRMEPSSAGTGVALQCLCPAPFSQQCWAKPSTLHWPNCWPQVPSRIVSIILCWFVASKCSTLNVWAKDWVNTCIISCFEVAYLQRWSALKSWACSWEGEEEVFTTFYKKVTFWKEKINRLFCCLFGFVFVKGGFLLYVYKLKIQVLSSHDRLWHLKRGKLWMSLFFVS